MTRSVIRTILIAVMFTAGCAGNREFKEQTTPVFRHEVFQELTTVGPVAGKAAVQVDFPVKSNRARFVNSYIKYSDPPYTTVITIDGQSAEMKDEPVLEDLPGDFRKNPEAGTGWKYNFRTALLLLPGKHLVTVAVPRSGIIIEKELILKEGLNNLKIVPIYKAAVSRNRNSPRFTNGLERIVILLDGQSL